MWVAAQSKVAMCGTQSRICALNLIADVNDTQIPFEVGANRVADKDVGRKGKLTNL